MLTMPGQQSTAPRGAPSKVGQERHDSGRSAPAACNPRAQPESQQPLPCKVTRRWSVLFIASVSDILVAVVVLEREEWGDLRASHDLPRKLGRLACIITLTELYVFSEHSTHASSDTACQLLP